MSIKRVRSGSFTTVNNAVLNDEKLSAEALGVLAYLLGKPNDWTVMPANLANRFGCGRDRIYRILKELIDAGYMFRSQGRSDETKSFEKIGYEVRDLIADPLPENTEAATPHTEKPLPGKPYTENPCPGNQTLQKKEYTKDIFEQSNEESDSSASEVLACPSDWPSDYENQWWKAYPRKHDKKPAMKVLNRIAKAGKTPWEELIAGTRHYAEAVAGKEARYIKHPATFLNAESWKNRYNRNHEAPKSFLDAALDFGNGEDGEPSHYNGH